MGTRTSIVPCPARGSKPRRSRISTARASETSSAVMWATRSMRTRSCARAGRSAADVGRPRRHASAAQLHDQPRRRARGQRGQVRIHALLPAIGRVGAQTEGLRGAQYLGAREVRRLEHDRLRALADLRVGAAHDAGDALRSLRVGDHEHRRVELALLPVQRAQRLARLRAPRRQASSAHVRVVVGVQRAAEVVHDVVGDVDDVRDRPHAGRAALAP